MLTSIGLEITVRTRASAATIGHKRGTGFQSTGAGRRGTLLLCRRCSTRIRRCRPFVILAGRPAAEWAPDASVRWIVALLFLDFAIQNCK